MSRAAPVDETGLICCGIATGHDPRCWRNPAVRGCKTCAHVDLPETCDVGIDLSRGLMTDCPQWAITPQSGDLVSDQPRLREELRPLAPLVNAAEKAIVDWRPGLGLDQLAADIVIAIAKELGGPCSALVERLKQAEIERDALRATVERVRRANEDMRGWCSPHNFAIRCADHIDEALDEPEVDQ